MNCLCRGYVHRIAQPGRHSQWRQAKMPLFLYYRYTGDETNILKRRIRERQGITITNCGAYTAINRMSPMRQQQVGGR